MAKMGQQMLPLSGATIANIESDEEQPKHQQTKKQWHEEIKKRFI
jgi:hypothetical protein